MNLAVFNTCIALGWAMVVGGAWFVSPPLALCVGGALLIGLTLVITRWVGFAAPANPLRPDHQAASR